MLRSLAPRSGSHHSLDTERANDKVAGLKGAFDISRDPRFGRLPVSRLLKLSLAPSSEEPCGCLVHEGEFPIRATTPPLVSRPAVRPLPLGMWRIVHWKTVADLRSYPLRAK